MEFKYKEFTFKSGDKVRCKIRGIEIFDAVISLEEHRGLGDRIYICHNVREAAGSNCYVKYGYDFSYCARGGHFINDVAHELSDEILDLMPSVGTKKNVSMDNSILEFLNIINKDYLKILFYSKIGSYDEYNRYFKSEKEGFLLLKTTPDPKSETPKKIKTLEIKFGRFLKAASKATLTPLTDSDIESLYNKWVSYQNQNLLKVSYLCGDDILKGYTRDNHLEVKDSSLQGSCMNDKHSFLELYTKNENVVKLAVMYIDDKIVARSLVWTTVSGTIVHDKIYSCKDWVYNAFMQLLKKEDINPMGEYGSLIVKLDKWKLKYYPYLDSFIYMDKMEGTLTYLNGSKVCNLQNQNGGPDIW
jgi:hypothetical protein